MKRLAEVAARTPQQEQEAGKVKPGLGTLSVFHFPSETDAVRKTGLTGLPQTGKQQRDGGFRSRTSSGEGVSFDNNGFYDSPTSALHRVDGLRHHLHRESAFRSEVAHFFFYAVACCMECFYINLKHSRAKC